MNLGFTSAARAAIESGGIHLYSSCDLLQRGEIVHGYEGIMLDDSDAEVSVDGTAAVRRTFSMTIPDPARYLPLLPTSALSPFRTEIRVWSGIVYDDGTFDRWAIFTGPIDDPHVDDSDRVLSMTLTASDRAQKISESTLAYARPLATGTPLVTAIQNLLLSIRSDLYFDVAQGMSSIAVQDGTVLDEGSDPWAEAQKMASAAGMEVFFAGDGRCVIRPIVQADIQSPVWEFEEGSTALIKTTGATLSRKNRYSHAYVTGMSYNGFPPIRADRYDLDPASPTYFFDFGDVPVKLDSQYIYNQSQADVACDALLARKTGASMDVSFTIVPITALDEYDVVYVNRPQLSLDTTVALEKFNIPCFASGEMSATCQSLRL